MDPERQCAVDLRADLALDLDGLRIRRNQFLVVREGTGRVEQARNLVRRLDTAPSVRFPLAGEREVQTEICIRVSLCVGGDFGDPGTRHHDACRRDGAVLEPGKACDVDGMGGGEIVRVKNEQFRVGGMAEALSYGFSLRGKRRGKQKRYYRRPKEAVHGRSVTIVEGEHFRVLQRYIFRCKMHQGIWVEIGKVN